MKRQQLAEEIDRLLRTRYKSVSNLAQETETSRESITRMQRGRSVRVDVVEKVARNVGEDVNHWREIAGYPPVPTADGADCERMRAIHAGLAAIREELGIDFSVDVREMFEAKTPEEIARFLARVRERELGRGRSAREKEEAR